MAQNKRPKGLRAPKQTRSFTVAFMAVTVVLSLTVLLAITSSSKANQHAHQHRGPLIYRHSIVKTYPHDENAFTQGLQYEQQCSQKQCRNILWESTGLNGHSTMRKVELETGAILDSHALPQEDFGEGTTRHGDRLYQLVWLKPTVWSYHVENLGADVQRHTSDLQDGWGITSNGQYLIITDSSPDIAFVDPDTMKTVRKITVHDGQHPVRWVNEIEWINGTIWGNVWQTECLVQINPEDGAVLAWALFEGITRHATKRSTTRQRMDVFNGVAWDEEGQRMFVTGKHWPLLYEVVLHQQHGTAEERAALHAHARQHCIK